MAASAAGIPLERSHRTAGDSSPAASAASRTGIRTVVTWLSSQPITPTPAMISRTRQDHAAAIRTGVVTMVSASAMGTGFDWGTSEARPGGEPACDVGTLDDMRTIIAPLRAPQIHANENRG